MRVQHVDHLRQREGELVDVEIQRGACGRIAACGQCGHRGGTGRVVRMNPDLQPCVGPHSCGHAAAAQNVRMNPDLRRRIARIPWVRIHADSRLRSRDRSATTPPPTTTSRRNRCARSSTRALPPDRRAARRTGCGPTRRRFGCGRADLASTTMPPPQPVPRMTPNTTSLPGAGTVRGLGEGEAVRVILHPDLAAQHGTDPPWSNG